MCAREPPAPPAPNSLRAAGDDATSGEVTALPNMCVQPPPNQQQSRRHQHTAFSGGDAATRICEARSLQGTDRVNQDDDRSKRRVVGQGHAKAYGSAVKDGDVHMSGPDPARAPRDAAAIAGEGSKSGGGGGGGGGISSEMCSSASHETTAHSE